MNLCKYCQFSKIIPGFFDLFCEKTASETDMFSCAIERNSKDIGSCGPNGKYFKQKIRENN
jgi:hypothetical protein